MAVKYFMTINCNSSSMLKNCTDVIKENNELFLKLLYIVFQI